jgi:N-acetylmuramoyl-L-alanine amidase
MSSPKVLMHRLAGVRFTRSPSQGGTLTAPTLLVMHYTAGRSFEQSVRTLIAPSTKASAHVVVGRAGEVAQLVRFDRVAWHAGQSEWRGRKRCNEFSIGIEIDNAGKLVRKAGLYATWFGAAIAPEDVHRGAQGSAWHAYTEQQLATLEAVTRAILEAYPSITEIVGHEDIAPGRKLDPGPAFPMARFRALLAERVA